MVKAEPRPGSLSTTSVSKPDLIAKHPLKENILGPVMN